MSLDGTLPKRPASRSALSLQAIENCVAAAGFSVGEFAALVFAGAMEFSEGTQGPWLVRGVFLLGSVGRDSVDSGAGPTPRLPGREQRAAGDPGAQGPDSTDPL